MRVENVPEEDPNLAEEGESLDRLHRRTQEEPDLVFQMKHKNSRDRNGQEDGYEEEAEEPPLFFAKGCKLMLSLFPAELTGVGERKYLQAFQFHQNASVGNRTMLDGMSLNRRIGIGGSSTLKFRDNMGKV